MSDWKNRTTTGSTFAVVVLILGLLGALILYARPSCAQEILKAELVLYPHALQVDAECDKRNGYIKRNSRIPSCFRGNKDGCIIIARQPDDTEEDLAAAALIAREINNCLRGEHKFPTNPD